MCRRRNLLVSGLERLGFTLPPRVGCGGFFLFPNVSAFAPRSAHAEGANTGERFANWIAKESKVAVVPGSVFGSRGADHIRTLLSG